MKFRLLFSFLLFLLLSIPARSQVSPKQSPVKPVAPVTTPVTVPVKPSSTTLVGAPASTTEPSTSAAVPTTPKKKPINDGLVHLNWGKPLSYQASSDAPTLHYLNLMGGSYSPKNHLLPQFFKQTKLNAGNNTATASVVNPKYEPLTIEELKALDTNKKWVATDINPKVKVVTSLKQFYVNISFIPVRKNAATGTYEKLVSFKLDVYQSREELKAVRPVVTFASNSVLQNGTWFRIGVTADGIYKLDSAFFEKMGVNVPTLVPADIRIYGNGGAMLPQSNAAYRADDLIENAIYIKGQTDTYFKPNDYVLFYAQSPNVWNYDASDTHFHHTVNVYSDTTFYFINIDGIGAAKNIANELLSTAPPTNTVTTFDDYAYHELDGVNLIQSGSEWVGEYFEAVTQYTFSFPFANISASGLVYVNTEVASVNCGTTSYYTASSSGSASISIPAGPVGCVFEDPYATMGTGFYTYTPASGALNVPVAVTKETTSAIGWLYYIETNVRRALAMPSNESQMEFRDIKSVGAGNTSLFTIPSTVPIQVWDVTNPQSVDSISLSKIGSSYNFEQSSASLKQYIAFTNTNTSFLTPTYFGKVANQDLHANLQADLIIVTNPLFINQANQLAAFHKEHDSLAVNVVTTQQVYNEFSSGLQDPTAIRDYLRMLYDRATGYKNTPKYLLLFGGGSFDPKHRTSGNTNYVVAYESGDSFDPVGSYVSDDYFVLLDSTVTTSPEDGDYLLDLSVGRLTVDNTTEAQTCVNKIILYETPSGQPATPSTNCCAATNQYTLGNWRNNVCFIAQDGNSNDFEDASETMSDYINTNFKNLNVNKIYFDAYPIVETPGGQRYPAVNTAIDNQMNQGLLLYNYEGHGGPTGLGVERTLDFTDIASWTNLYAMPLFFNGSCAFGEWDNPLQVSGGQLSVNLPSGGVISMVSATRAVYLNENEDINDTFIVHLYTPLPDGSLPRIGDLLTVAKNDYHGGTIGGGDVNNLSYTLVGDPAVRLNYPKYNIQTSSINAKVVTPTSPADTLQALEKVTISGYVADNSGNPLTSFNGLLNPIIYDKPVSITTLANDGGDSPYGFPFTFGIQNSELYRGVISVINGKFTFTYVMPKDILYYYGFGKISYYAQNGTTDATGNYQNIDIGGTSPTAHNNGLGPKLRLYMNDSNFAYDGLTNQNPNLYAIVFDSNGVNTSGTSIGHDMTAILDNNTANTYDISNYYQPALNSYQKGTITYPLSSLSNGTHTLSLRVWNVYNNTSMVTTEFNVEPQSSLQLQHVLNYPNPFTTHTQFYFEINEVCDQMDVQIQIFSVSGKLVKNILTSVKTNSFRSEPIDWDGRDDYGERIANGVYIYHLKVRTSSGVTADTYQKLVIL